MYGENIVRINYYINYSLQLIFYGLRFKQVLDVSFMQYWLTDEMIPFTDNKQVFNFRQCHSFIVRKVVSEIEENVTCPQHVKTDTKIVYHICNINGRANFVIRCSDTNITANMLGNMHNLESKDSHVWILTGTGNKLRCLEVTKIYELLGSSLCQSLPGFPLL